MMDVLNGWKRSDYCGELTKADLGRELTLMGWVQRRRELGGLTFVFLRDRTGIMQVVFDESKLPRETFDKAQTIRNEFVLAVKGRLVARDAAAINPSMPTGDIEVIVDELKILSKSETPPFMIDDETQPQSILRLEHRYLDLRRPELQRIQRLRHQISKIARDYYDSQGFIEIETPILCKSTPEGARDYLVPSRVHPGEFYALPQSPQLFKQLLMISGFDRYFQIAKCFRDEDLRADRQPEFTQIDVEMSFVEDEEDVMQVHEGFVAQLFSGILGREAARPFLRIPYSEAMDRFGSDKPDIRFGLELVDVSDIARETDFQVFKAALSAGGTVRAINAKDSGGKLPRKEIDRLVEFVKQYRAKGMAWISVTEGGVKSSLRKFFTDEQMQTLLSRCDAQPNDTIFLVSDAAEDVVFAALGALRLELAHKFDLIDEDQWGLLWVTDFPQFEYDADEQRFVAKHHPFTAPKNEDIDKLESDPASVRAKAYDLVLNGYELGGGSIRISDPDLQKRMFRVLGFSDEEAKNRFGFFLEAFQYGTPPHGGLAFGLDRLVMLLAGTNNIRDVIAFPKIQNASDPMSKAPSPVDESQLRELSLRVDIREK